MANQAFLSSIVILSVFNQCQSVAMLRNCKTDQPTQIKCGTIIVVPAMFLDFGLAILLLALRSLPTSSQIHLRLTRIVSRYS